MISKVLLISAVVSIVASKHTLDEALVGECGYEELKKCDKGIALFVNDKHLPETEDEKAERCENQAWSIECFVEFGNKCLTGLEKGLYLILMDSFKEEIETRCADGSPQNVEYTKHVGCWNTVPEIRQCVRTSVMGINWINQEIELKDQIKTTCCIFPHLKDCLRDAIADKCGQDSFDHAETILEKYFNELLDVACKKHQKTGCDGVAKIPQDVADDGEDLYFINPLVKLAHVAPKYP